MKKEKYQPTELRSQPLNKKLLKIKKTKIEKLVREKK
jgi:hypothetical protein